MAHQFRGPVKNAFSNMGKYSLQLYLLNGYLLTIARIIIVNILHIHIAAIIISFILIFDLAVSLIITILLLNKVNIFKLISGIPVKDVGTFRAWFNFSDIFKQQKNTQKHT
jgi:hypothetical protein